MKAWREALRILRFSLVARVWLGTAVLAVLAALWLQIPDSHVWQFAFSILYACGWLAAILWFYSVVFRKMLGQAEAEGRAWLNWLLLAAVVVAWWLLQMPIDKLAKHSELYAGYWVSRLPHGLRGLHSYEHFLSLQEAIFFLLRLVVVGLLLPVAVVAGVGRLRDGAAQLLRVWTKWWYWVAVVACGWVAVAVSDKLMGWTPGHKVAAEMLSLLLRLGSVFTLDVLLACFVVAVAVVALRRRATGADDGLGAIR